MRPKPGKGQEKCGGGGRLEKDLEDSAASVSQPIYFGY